MWSTGGEQQRPRDRAPEEYYDLSRRAIQLGEVYSEGRRGRHQLDSTFTNSPEYSRLVTLGLDWNVIKTQMPYKDILQHFVDKQSSQ